MTNNLIEDVNNIGIDFIGGESWLSSKFARNGRCAWNRVFRANSSYEDGYAAGIYVDGGSDIIIENNTVSECDLGIEVGAENYGVVTSDVNVRNNVVYKNNKTGIVFGGYDVNTGRVKNCSFTGNTCYQNDVLKVGNGELWIQYAEDNEVRNNIFYANDQNLLIASAAGNVNNAIDYNLWHTDAGESGASFVWNGTVYGSFSAYKSGTGQDSHSAFDNPVFANVTAADFHISGSSPAVDLGDPAFIPAVNEVDVDGQARIAGSRVDAGTDEVNTTSSAEFGRHLLPEGFQMYPAFPNPFNPQTIINYQLPIINYVELDVINVRGQKEAVLVAGVQTAGKHKAKWDGKNSNGQRCPSGLYFARLKQGAQIQTIKLILMK